MSDNTGGGGLFGRLERILTRVLLLALAGGVTYLQTGQWSLEGGEQARDTDTVALMKVVHRLELRIQRLEDVGHPEMGPMAHDEPLIPVPASAAASDEAIDIRRALGAIRSMVSKEEIETYQQAK